MGNIDKSRSRLKFRNRKGKYHYVSVHQKFKFASYQMDYLINGLIIDGALVFFFLSKLYMTSLKAHNFDNPNSSTWESTMKNKLTKDFRL